MKYSTDTGNNGIQFYDLNVCIKRDKKQDNWGKQATGICWSPYVSPLFLLLRNGR